MRLVLDTNVYVSALIKRESNPGRLLTAWRAGFYNLLISPPLFAELEGVLARKKLRRYVFQSSPAPKGRCNVNVVEGELARLEFQSSPAPKGRCNRLRAYLKTITNPVSILTGPEGPVQRLSVFFTDRNLGVSILTGPEGPVQPACFSCRTRTA